MRVQPDGSLALKDLRSTNGTYIARDGDFLRRMREDEVWELKRGDTVGFGGLAAGTHAFKCKRNSCQPCAWAQARPA